MLISKYFRKFFLKENELDYPIFKRIKWCGIEIEIENPKGSIRKGIDYNGKSWETKMLCDYGRIKNTKGKDGDMLDIFIKENPSNNVYVVFQRNPYTNMYDENKYMIGFNNIDDAKEMYLKHYDNPNYLMNIFDVTDSFHTHFI